MPAIRIDWLLLGALAAPALVWPWVPAWDDGVLQGGLLEAGVLVASIAVIEEVIFRGFLQGVLLKHPRFAVSHSGISRANGVTSLLFALGHSVFHPWWLLPGYGVVGLLFGYFRERYHGILLPVLLHAYYNLGLLLFR